MRFLFIDFECSNCFNGQGKICEFGYVLTDGNFQILEKGDIPMSPGKGRRNRFDKGIYKRDHSFRFSYEEEEYFTYPEFPAYYEKIKGLMEAEGTTIIGHAVSNDIGYLKYTCERYKLPEIQCEAYEELDMIKALPEIPTKSRHLTAIYHAVGNPEEFPLIQPHLPRDDAFMTMRIVENVCRQTGKKPEVLLAGCGVRRKLEKRATFQALRKLYPEIQTKKPRIFAHALWNLGVQRAQDAEGGVRILASRKLQTKPEEIQKFLQAIEGKNIRPVKSPLYCDVEIIADQEEKEKRSGAERGSTHPLMTLSEYLERI